MNRMGSSRPKHGQYRICDPALAGPAWLAPSASGNLCGAGPAFYLGSWDTLPHLEPWAPDALAALHYAAAPDGLTLRWQHPRLSDTRNTFRLYDYAPAWRYAQALTLYVAAFDVLEDSNSSLFSWPGQPPGSSATDLKTPAAQWPADSRWANQILAATPVVNQNSVVPQMLARLYARPALDLLAYAVPGGWCEADLIELAGGCRYVSAWLGFAWSRWQGTDWLTGSNADYYLPWTLLYQPSDRACHRKAYHVGWPTGVDGTIATPASSAEIFTSSTATRRGIYSPIQGRWRMTWAMNNPGPAGPGAQATMGLEIRATDWLERLTALVDNTLHPVLESRLSHAGSAVAAFFSSDLPTVGGIAGISVTPT